MSRNSSSERWGVALYCCSLENTRVICIKYGIKKKINKCALISYSETQQSNRPSGAVYIMYSIIDGLRYSSHNVYNTDFGYLSVLLYFQLSSACGKHFTHKIAMSLKWDISRNHPVDIDFLPRIHPKQFLLILRTSAGSILYMESALRAQSIGRRCHMSSTKKAKRWAPELLRHPCSHDWQVLIESVKTTDPCLETRPEVLWHKSSEW